ncbi:hypothetical protein C7S18_12210 [Ahniella affigens]|uniref:ArsR family transcriptional regulator n=1 Tax=Ahniella affigens TaxID=2021234 RepID=A0A2P1PST4_9GAMM|nr:hypothetical protein [Ahniella affigens]AVP97915.1 hypothetical protein C7S18_12210 [Ahniella affigens]
MSKAYNDFYREERRLNILRLLDRANAFRATASVLYAQLDAMGDPGSRDDVATDSQWLHEQGLVVAEQVADGVTLLTLTERGQDVVSGKTRVPGVKRAGLR